MGQNRADAAIPGLTAVLPLATGREAFAARVALMRAAGRTLDLQHYIWHPDLTGQMMMAEALAAADRGVRVRLLVDDNGIGGLDPLLAAVDTHPKIEVRIFNPFPTRRAKWIGFITDFRRVNHRMHNKSMTADGMVSIIGGRNIGDEYFDAHGVVTFADLDVVAVGSAAGEIDSDFDRYWDSDAVWPAGLLLRPAPAGALDRLRAATVEAEGRPEVAAYRRAVHETLTIAEIGPRMERRDWVKTRLVSDDPAKVTGRADRSSLLLARLGEGHLGRGAQRIGNRWRGRAATTRGRSKSVTASRTPRCGSAGCSGYCPGCRSTGCFRGLLTPRTGARVHAVNRPQAGAAGY